MPLLDICPNTVLNLSPLPPYRFTVGGLDTPDPNRTLLVEIRALLPEQNEPIGHGENPLVPTGSSKYPSAKARSSAR
jgi:hypothetical protein